MVPSGHDAELPDLSGPGLRGGAGASDWGRSLPSGPPQAWSPSFDEFAPAESADAQATAPPTVGPEDVSPRPEAARRPGRPRPRSPRPS